MYRPKIKEGQIKDLYQLKQKVGKPMTRLVEEAVEAYLEKEVRDVKAAKVAIHR